MGKGSKWNLKQSERIFHGTGLPSKYIPNWSTFILKVLPLKSKKKKIPQDKLWQIPRSEILEDMVSF